MTEVPVCEEALTLLREATATLHLITIQQDHALLQVNRMDRDTDETVSTPRLSTTEEVRPQDWGAGKVQIGQ